MQRDTCCNYGMWNNSGICSHSTLTLYILEGRRGGEGGGFQLAQIKLRYKEQFGAPPLFSLFILNIMRKFDNGAK